MSLEDFQEVDNEPIDKGVVKRVFFKFYHQQRANLNDLDQKVEFIFGKSRVTIILKAVIHILNLM